MRRKLREAITNEAAKQTFDELIRNVISHKLQSSLKSSVKKILPLRALEIRRLNLVSESEKKASESEETKETDTAKKAKKEKTAIAEDKGEAKEATDKTQ